METPLKGLGDNGRDDLAVLARGHLRNHAAEAGVELILRGDDSGPDLAPAAHDRGRGLVAG